MFFLGTDFAKRAGFALGDKDRVITKALDTARRKGQRTENAALRNQRFTIGPRQITGVPSSTRKPIDIT